MNLFHRRKEMSAGNYRQQSFQKSQKLRKPFPIRTESKISGYKKHSVKESNIYMKQPNRNEGLDIFGEGMATEAIEKITKRFKNYGKNSTEKEFLKVLGPVITNAVNWDGHRALRAKNKTKIDLNKVQIVFEDDSSVKEVEQIQKNKYESFKYVEKRDNAQNDERMCSWRPRR
ncbi:uncharacterized protein LOC117182607 [Belonocnema kinseyi]|uniref:uncharacterized protein LOC117182607 n=1 Tax=Belonocnema kinseyi TaxID=2817044 RepID=UPI00143CC60D|nr:uncharacterized protein LOC117182607 [Belonocnema kinseyi]